MRKPLRLLSSIFFPSKLLPRPKPARPATRDIRLRLTVTTGEPSAFDEIHSSLDRIGERLGRGIRNGFLEAGLARQAPLSPGQSTESIIHAIEANLGIHAENALLGAVGPVSVSELRDAAATV